MSNCESGKCDAKGKGKCDDCDNKGGGPKNWWAKFKARLARFRRCEPFCGVGGCTPVSVFPYPEHRADGVVTIVENDAVNMLMNLGVRAGIFTICTDPVTGKLGYGVPDGPCIVTQDECKMCSVFGPHGNAMVRSGNISPDAAEAIANGYKDETLQNYGPEPGLIGPFAVPDRPGWYYVMAGNIGVSHEFCLDAFGATIVDDTGTRVPLAVAKLAVAGTRIVCSRDRPGHYVEVFGPYDAGNTSEITGEAVAGMLSCVRRCRPICEKTPAEGGEVYFFKGPVGLTPAQLLTVQVTLHVERCKFLFPVDWCVSGQGNLITVPAVETITFVTIPRRVNVPVYLPS